MAVAVRSVLIGLGIEIAACAVAVVLSGAVVVSGGVAG